MKKLAYHILINNLNLYLFKIRLFIKKWYYGHIYYVYVTKYRKNKYDFRLF